ncbi:MAG TPA: hypothetical protein VJ974_01630 [Geopsychrobacteraceae bacterium]|nr:hypothetical protein [Geopsychrobacteraceae bacterium]
MEKELLKGYDVPSIGADGSHAMIEQLRQEQFFANVPCTEGQRTKPL